MVMKSDQHKIQPEEANKAMPPPPSPKKNKKKNYKGVRMRSWGSWVSEIRAPNQKTRIWLGSYSTPEAAARAYDAALLCLKGTSANLNFPISSYNLPPHTILSPKSIQRVAAAAAAAAAASTDTFSDSPTSTIAPPSPPPPLPPSSSSSFSSPSLSSSASSLSMYSSPSNHIEDDIFVSTLDAHTPYEAADEPMSLINTSWYNFDSPKYTDLLNGALFDPPMFENVYEEGDIRLWNFC